MKLKHSVAAVALVATTIAVPARSQSIVDTFRQFKGTLKQLSGKRAAGDDVQVHVGPAAKPDAGFVDEGRAVPLSVLADDPSDTALERAAPGSRRVIDFDIRGFKLGMSPRDVGRISDREGFRRKATDILNTTAGFEVLAAAMANRKLNRPVDAVSKLQLSNVEAFDWSGNHVTLAFTIEPGGPRLSDIMYDAKLNGSTRDATIAALNGKYGKPTKTYMQLEWTNGAAGIDLSSPTLIAVVNDDRMSLHLVQSVSYKDAAKRRLEERAQQIAAAAGGGVRF